MHHFHFTPLPELKTQHLIIRRLVANDATDIFLLRSNEQVNKFINRKQTENVEEALAFIENINEGIADKQWLYWAIVLKENLKLVGTITLWQFSEEENNAELGYELHPHYQRKGLMNEAINAVIMFAFKKIQLHKLYAWTHKDNTSSARLLERNNFKRDLEEEKKNTESGALKSMVIYSLINRK